MGNAICASAELGSTFTDVACNVESVTVSLTGTSQIAVHIAIDSVSSTYHPQSSDVAVSVASASAKSQYNGWGRELLKLQNGLSFSQRKIGAQIILRPLAVLIDIDCLNSAAEVVSAAIPPLPPKSVVSPRQPIKPALETLCISVSSIEATVAVDSNAAIALSLQSMEYHYNCPCRGKPSGCLRVSRLKLLTLLWRKESDDARTSISSDIDLDIMLTPKLDQVALVLESALTFTISFAVISLGHQLLSKLAQLKNYAQNSKQPQNSQPVSKTSSLDMNLRFSSIALVITSDSLESVTLSVAHIIVGSQKVTIGNVALLYSDRTNTSSILSCVSSPVATIDISPNSTLIELTTFRLCVPLKLLEFLASVPSPPDLDNLQKTEIVVLRRRYALRILLPLFELRLHRQEQSSVLAMVQICDLFALCLPTIQEADHVHSDTNTLRCAISIIIGDNVLLRQTLISLEQVCLTSDFSRVNSSYPFSRKEYLSISTDDINMQVYPEQIQSMHSISQFINRLPPPQKSSSRKQSTAAHISSHDDLRSLYFDYESVKPKPGRITLSDNEIAWCYLTSRCISHVSLSALHVAFETTLTLSAIDLVTNRRIIVDQVAVDLNRTTAHQVAHSVMAETWIISWTASSLLSSADLVQILRIDSVSGNRISRTVSTTVPSLSVTLSSKRDGLEADHAIISAEDLNSKTFLTDGLAALTMHLKRFSASVFRYSDLAEAPVALTSDIEILLVNHSGFSGCLIPIMLCHYDKPLFVKISLPKKFRLNISSFGIDALIYMIESFRDVPSQFVYADAITFAGNTTKPHHCSQILLRNNLGVPLHYRQEGQLKTILLPPGEIHNFTWPSVMRQQLRISCHPGLWSDTFPLKDDATIRLIRPKTFTDLHLRQDDNLYSFDAQLYVTSQLSFPLELMVLTISDDDSEDVSAYTVTFLPESAITPVPLWLPNDRSVSINYQFRPRIDDVEWLWSTLSENSLITFQSTVGNHQRSVWFYSDGSTIHLLPAVTVSNHTESIFFVSLNHCDPFHIDPHQSVPIYEFHDTLQLAAAFQIDAINADESITLQIPREGESNAACLKITKQSNAIAVATLDTVQGLQVKLFSSVTFRNLTEQQLAVLDRNNEEIPISPDGVISVFWANPIDARFFIIFSDGVLRSQPLHCKRSGTFDIDLCSAVKLSVTRIVMSVTWTASCSSKSYDASSRCEITLQSRYCIHNRCRFPIAIRPDSPNPDNSESITVNPGASRDILGWCLAAPPISAIRESPSFESGSWLLDNSALRLTRIGADKNHWGWSSSISCFAKDDRQQRALIKLRNRQSGFDIVLSCLRLREDNITHLVFVNDVQAPLLLVNATPFKLLYYASSVKSPTPSNLNFVKTEVEPHQSTQIPPETCEDERIFANGVPPMTLHLRAVSTDWSTEPVLLRSTAPTQSLELSYLSSGSMHVAQPHMLGNSPTRAVKSAVKFLTLEVDCYDRNGTLVTVVSVKDDQSKIAATPPVQSSRFEIAADSVETCFLTSSDKTGFVFFLDSASVLLDQRFEPRYARILNELTKPYVPGRTASVQIRSFQLEHIANAAEYPIVAHSADNESSNSSIEITVNTGTQIVSDGEDQSNPLLALMQMVHIEDLSMSLSPFRLYIEDVFLSTVTNFARELSRSLFRIQGQTYSKLQNEHLHAQTPKGWRSNPEFAAFLYSMCKPRFAVHRLSISSIELRVTYSGSRPYLACQSLPVTLAALELFSVLSATDRLIKELSANYLADLIMIAPALFGSMDLFGNPTHLISSISRGVADLVRLPTRALTQGPRALVWATLQGVGSLLHNMSEGTLTSVSGFTHSLARNVGGVSPDHYHIFQTNQNTPAIHQRGVSTGLVNGATSLAAGVVLGVTGVVSAPIRGVARQGTWGFVKGVGAGLAGLITKPVSGALDMVSETSRGIAASAGLSPILPPLKFHQEQAIVHDDILDRISTLRLKALSQSMQESYRKHFYIDSVLDAEGAILYQRAIFLCTHAALHVIASGSDQVVHSLAFNQIEVNFSGSDSVEVRHKGDVLFQFVTDHAIRQLFLNCICNNLQQKP